MEDQRRRTNGKSEGQMVYRIITAEDGDGRSYVGARDEFVPVGILPISTTWNLWRVPPNGTIPGPGTPPEPLPDIANTVPGEVLVFRWILPAHTDATESSEILEFKDRDRPGYHSTYTIDVDTILQGEVVLRLDKEEVTIHTGDTVVVRGQSHAWANRSDEDAVILTTMVGAPRNGAST